MTLYDCRQVLLCPHDVMKSNMAAPGKFKTAKMSDNSSKRKYYLDMFQQTLKLDCIFNN